MEAWRTKNRGWRKVEDEVCGSLHASKPNFVVPSPLPLIFTKMPL